MFSQRRVFTKCVHYINYSTDEMSKSISFEYMWGFLFLVSLLYHHGNALSCYICKPSLIEGGTVSRNLALRITNNMTTTFESSELDFGNCINMTMTSSFQRSCPSSLSRPACMKLVNEFWTARTCISLGAESSAGCSTDTDNATYCYCNGELCNGAKGLKIESLFIALPLLGTIFSSMI